MSFKEYGEYDAVGLAELVRTRQLAPQELLDEAVSRSERLNPEINAVVVHHEDYAKRQIDSGLPEAPFTGVPFLLKDLELLEGTRTTFGARVYKHNVADHSGNLAQRFLAAGLTIFGKSASSELGLMPTTECLLHGPTRNPWNLAHSAGGSSGGAAAAVAARILPVAHASDGGGSIRIPASACGVFGLKPTRSRTPCGPDKGEGLAGFACGHVVSVSVRDTAAMLDAVHGPEPTSPYRAPVPERPFIEEVGHDPGSLRIFFTDKSPYGDAIDPEIAAAVRDVARLLESNGHHVEEGAPLLPVDPATVISTIFGSYVGSYVRDAEQKFGRPMTLDDFDRVTLAALQRGCNTSALDYLTGMQNSFLVSRSLVEFFGKGDVFLSPTLCQPPIRIGEIDTMSSDLSTISPLLRRYMPGTGMANISGQPSMSVPLAWSSSGLPLGMMFTGRFGDEATLLRLAAQLEQIRPWKHRRPPICA